MAGQCPKLSAISHQLSALSVQRLAQPQEMAVNPLADS
jgi:hypothetical protein